MEASLQSTEGVVEEIMRIHRSLPARPSVEEVEALRTLIKNVEREEQARLEAISKERKGIGVHGELFSMLQDMQSNVVAFRIREERREGDRLMDLERFHARFDEYLQRASKFIPGVKTCEPASHSNGYISGGAVVKNSAVTGSKAAGVDQSSTLSIVSAGIRSQNQRDVGRSTELVTRDDSYVNRTKAAPFLAGEIGGHVAMQSRSVIPDSAAKSTPNVGEDGDKLSFIKFASLIEVPAKKGTRELALQNKLMDQIEWLPDSIGKLSKLVKLDLSGNRILALPGTIGSLSALTFPDLHSNRIAELPKSIGNLLTLVYLNISSNQLTVLPPSLGKLSRLTEIDLSSNGLEFLPDTIGNLVNLKKLNIETNDIEDLPHTIGHCFSLVELRAEYNHLQALPEAVGKLQSLEVLLVRYNNIKMLPTTMASMSNLRELDVSFNELESLPESLCLATTLVRLNLGNNFADLKSLPRAIGNLEMLDELDIGNNQIRVLPDSFVMLSNLQVLHVYQNPLEVPPRQIAEMGAQEILAVVHFMAELVAKRDVKTAPAKQKRGWAQFCFLCGPKKRKYDDLDSI